MFYRNEHYMSISQIAISADVTKLVLIHLKIRLLTNYWLTYDMYNHLTERKKMSSGSFRILTTNYAFISKVGNH